MKTTFHCGCVVEVRDPHIGPVALAHCPLHAAASDLLAALVALADRTDATSECDHKRVSCEAIGCIGVEVKQARAAIAKAKGQTP